MAWLLAACGAPPQAAVAPAVPTAAPAGAGGSAAVTPGVRAPTSGAVAPAPQAVAAAPAGGRDAYPAADDPMAKVRVGWCATVAGNFHLWVGKEAGIFARHRLDLEFASAQGGASCQALLDHGEVDFLQSAGAAVVPRLMSGVDSSLIANIHKGNPYRLMVNPEVQRLTDLRGRKLATSRTGDFDYWMTEMLLEHHGLVPNQDVLLVPIGSQPDRYNAARAGVVDGVLVPSPVSLIARRDGFRELYSMEEMGLPALYTSLYTTSKTLQERPRLVQRFLAAMIETMAFARTEREVTIRVMNEYLRLDDRPILEGAYQTFAVDLVAIPPYVPLDGVQTVVEQTLRFNPTAQVRDPARFVDHGPLRAVEASGFVEAVVAAYPVP